MCPGAKAKTKSTSTYTPTAQASGAYTAALTGAQTAAQTPYNPATEQQVAGFTPAQTQAFQKIEASQGGFQPLLNQGVQYAQQAAGPITGAQIANYQNPFQSQVIDATTAQLNQQNKIAQSGVAGNSAIRGALGGNRVGVAQAQLAGEQGRNMNSTVAGLNLQGFNTALSAAQQDAQRQQAAATQMGQFAGQQQGFTMNDIQALLTSGNQQQAQQQAGYDASTANAQNQTMWPYLNNQYLASIAGSLGPLTGGTTTGSGTTQQNPGLAGIVGGGLTAAGMLSDRRAKENLRRIGYTDDGQNIYEYNYKGSPRKQIGLVAQEVEQRHPEAVGENGPGGMKMVDYGKALDFARGGSVHPGSSFAQAMPGGFFPWAKLNAAPLNAPSLMAPPALTDQGGGMGDMKAAFSMGKQARSGLEGVLRGLDPAKGWGASLEPTAGFAAGGGIFGGDDTFGIDPATGRKLLPSYNAELQDEDMGPPDALPAPAPRAGFGSWLDMGAGDAFRYGDQPMMNMDAEAMPTAMEPNAQQAGSGRSAFANAMGMGAGDALAYGDQPMLNMDAEAMPTPGMAPAAPQLGGSMPDMSAFANAMSMGANMAPRAPSGIDAEAMPYAMEPGGAAPQAAPGGFTPPPAGDVNQFGDPLPAAFEFAPAPDTRTVENSAGQGLSTIDFIKQQEGLKLDAYRDGRQNSIGYGTRATSLKERITPEVAEARLAQDVGKVETWLDKNITAPMTQGQRAGLTSFGFNLGTDDLAKLKDDINSGNWANVAARMPTFDKAENETTGKLESVEGLRTRRLREAALMTGGTGDGLSTSGSPTTGGFTLPASDGGRTAGSVNAIAEKATDPRQPETGRYTNAADKQAGGLLKRMFGLDFNPLKLDEDERQAMIVAGLGMMGSGNIGTGGMQGMQFLSGKRAGDREADLAATKLGMDLRRQEHTEALDAARLGFDIDKEANKTTDNTREYEVAKAEGFGGSFLDFISAKKAREGASSTQIPAEVAARIGLARAFQSDLPSIKKGISELTLADRVDIPLRRGKAGDLWRRIESGTEAMKRQMTGAGMSENEAQNYIDRYQLSATDKTETMLHKIDLLDRDLQATTEGALSGKTGLMGKEYKAGNASPPSARPRAKNAAGDVVEWNGSAWVTG